MSKRKVAITLEPALLDHICFWLNREYDRSLWEVVGLGESSILSPAIASLAWHPTSISSAVVCQSA